MSPFRVKRIIPLRTLDHWESRLTVIPRVIECPKMQLLVRHLPLGQKYSYTTGMKTAVSIPEDVFKGAERLARKTKRSRSRLFSDALKEYLARHTPDSVTEAMNKACSELGAAKDEFVSSAARRVLERSEW